MERLTLKPVRHVEGQIKLPGSKSLSITGSVDTLNPLLL